MGPSLWKNRSFVYLWLAQATANIGDQFYGIALLWYLLQQTKSAASLSLIAIPEMIAGFLFYMFGGVLADRYSTRKLMVGADLARLVTSCLVGFIVLAGAGELPFFLFMQFLIGIFSSIFYPAKTVALKSIVAEDQLSRANAILDTTFRTIRILAPMTIGVFAGILPIFAMFFVNASSYLFSALFLFCIRQNVDKGEVSASSAMTASHYLRDISGALREVGSNRYLLYVMVFANMGFLVWQVCWSVGFPVLANQMGHGDAGMLGVMVGSYGVGNLLGSLYMAKFTYKNHLFVILVGWAFQAVGFLTLAIAQDFQALVLIAAGIAGVGGPLIGIPNLTAIQTKVERANTGKVFALNMLAFTGFSVCSSSLGALWLGKLPVVQLFLVSSIFLMVMIIIGFRLNKTELRKSMKDQLFSG